MKFLDGYILVTIITGIVSLLNHLNQWDIDAIWILSPVVIYLILSAVIALIKEITKTKG